MQTAVGVFLVLFLAVAASGFAVRDQDVDEEVSEVLGEQQLQSSQLENFWKRSSRDSDDTDELGGRTRGTKGTRSIKHGNKGSANHINNANNIGAIIDKIGGSDHIINVCVAVKCRFRSRRSEVEDQLETESDAGATKSETEKLNVELFESKSVLDFRSYYNEKVVKAALYSIPSSALGKNVVDNRELLDGVLATLSNGRRLMITRGPELWGDEQSAILEVEDLTDNWKFVESKNVQFSVVADYVSASDSSSNTREAATRMMALD